MKSSLNAERAAQILLVLGDFGIDGLTLREIAARIGEPKPTVHRALFALTRYGLVEKLKMRGRYRLGAAIYALARRKNSAGEKAQFWSPVIAKVAKTIGYNCYLMHRSGLDAVVLHMHLGEAPIQVLASGVGGRLPLGLGPGGACILASLDSEEREAVLETNKSRYEERGIEVGIVSRIVDKAVEQGFAIDIGETLAGCGGFAMPIRDRDGTTNSAISVAMPVQYLTNEKIHFLAELLEREIKQRCVM
jgi:DNA-binding IclR family transcriptional regulator